MSRRMPHPLGWLAVALAGVLVVEVTLLSLRGGGDAAEERAEMAGGQPQKPPAVGVLTTGILARPLFNPARAPERPSNASAAAALTSETKLLRVVGTAIQGDARYAWIELAGEEGQAARVEEGDTVADVWTVTKITRKSVTLNGPSGKKVLDLNSFSAATKAWQAAHPDAIQHVEDPDAAEPDPNDPN